MATAEAPTLTAVLKAAAAAFPSRRAVAVPGGHELTHAALDALVDDAAARLAAGAGILPGHVVALAFPTNTVELVIMFLAVVRARAMAAPLDPAALTKEELELYLSDSQARLLITSAEGNAAAQAAASKLGLSHVAASLPDPTDPVHLTGLPADSTAGNGNGSKYPGFTADNDPSDVALLVYTTSRREVVPLTQGDLAASVQNVGSAYGLVETDAAVAVVPLPHVHGILAVLLGSLASGASVSLPTSAAGRFSASAFWADMRASGATWYAAVPTVHQILLGHHASKPEAPFPALRFVGSYGASLAPETLEKLEAAFGAPVLEAAQLMTPNPLPQDDKYGKGFSVEKKTTGGRAGGAGQNNGGFTEQLRHGLPVLGLCVASVAVAGMAAGAATPPATGLGLFLMLIVGLSTVTIRVLRA